MSRILVISAVFLLAGCAPSSIMPLRESSLRDWSCPASGTVLDWEDRNGRRGTDRFAGADSQTPEICDYTTNGIPRRSWFLVREIGSQWTADEQNGFQAAIRALLNGRSSMAGFTDRRNNVQVSHIWHVVGEENLVVGGRTVRAVRISGQNIYAGDGRSWTFTRWYDPDRHVWLKTVDGSNGSEWRATAITDP